MHSGRGPFVLVALVVVGCLGAGIALAIFVEDTPAMLMSVVLACAVAALLYGILGGVSEAGFNFGPVKMGGSAAVLLGGAFLFNQFLQEQMQEIRRISIEEAVEEALRGARFIPREHIDPSEGWIAIDRETAMPISVRIKNPEADSDPEARDTLKTFREPSEAVLQLRLNGGKDDEGPFLVSGLRAADDRGLGYINLRELEKAIDLSGDFKPIALHGPRRVHLVAEGELDESTPRDWGSSGRCLGKRLPMRLRAERFDSSYADYSLFACGTADESTADHHSSLAPGQSELVELTIDGDRRNFLISVLAANHQEQPFWSSFLVTEMEEE